MDAAGNRTITSARVVVRLDDAIVAEVRLSGPVTVVGRHPSCDIVLSHAAVSARHMLLRQVDGAVYVEDLASTNGTRVNGSAVENQAVHHRDLIEIGRHKIDFFEDPLPATDAGDPGATPASDAPADAQPRKAAARRDDDDLSRTMALPRDPAIRLGPAQEVVRTDQALAGSGLAFRRVEGGPRGEVIAFDRSNTMIGTSDGDNALVVKRGQALFLARFSGHRAPRLNRKDLGAGTHPIHAGDVIEVGESVFEVIPVA